MRLETYSMGKLHAKPISSGFCSVFSEPKALEIVLTILCAIQSKKASPSRFLISRSILKDSSCKMLLPLPEASRPLSSTRATRNVDPPTSRARYCPCSDRLGN